MKTSGYWFKAIVIVGLSSILAYCTIKKLDRMKRQDALRAELNSMSRDALKDRIIAEHDKAPIPCQCPYDTDRNGNACGYRSAYDRPGGYAPICYRKNVPDQYVDRWIEKKVEKVE